METSFDEPANRIANDAVKVWRIDNTIESIITLLIGAGLIFASIYFDWLSWITLVLILLFVLDAVYTLWEIAFEPNLRWRYWHYAIDREYVQIKHGILKRTHTITPMTKVQYVTAEQGPILRKYQLYTIEVGTIDSSLSIPAIPEEEALSLRADIASYAKLKEAGDHD